MTRVRLALGVGAATLVVAAAAASAAPPQSLAPDVVGWWSAANRNPAVPALPPPDVGAKDLYVAGSNALPGQLTGPTGIGPAAIAALRFRLPDGVAVRSLRLKLAGMHPPAVTLSACRATKAFTAAYDGAWADAPTYDCTDAGTARLGSDGSVVFDGVDAIREGRDLAVVLVPGPLDRVVVAAPDRTTLAVTASAGPVGSAPGGGAALPPASQPTGSGTSGPALGSETAGLPTAATAGAAPAVAAPAPTAPLRAAAATPRPAVPPRPWPALLATLLVAAAAFVPMVRPLRRPQPAGAASARGVGRFRSERTGVVPDLA